MLLPAAFVTGVWAWHVGSVKGASADSLTPSNVRHSPSACTSLHGHVMFSDTVVLHCNMHLAEHSGEQEGANIQLFECSLHIKLL